ncbi:MAG: cytochrome c3 family protein [Dehalococcoidia bacterium]|nr:cytochrome c3 family protein [Dehalococcoidia bacterium]
MNKEMRHLARAGIVLGLFIAGIIIARQVLTPDSFGQFGYYRGDNVAEWAGLPLTFSETALCAECHSPKYTQWSSSAHAGVSCENCHGPAVAHIEKKQPLTVNRASSLCLTCHERLLSRPSSFPQVISTQHNPGVSCATCHNPHNPVIGQPPAIPHSLEGRADCLLCHGSQGLKPAPLNHAGRTIEICQLCHKPGSATPSKAPPISSPTAATAAPTGTPTATNAAAGPPLIPHSLAGRDDCLLCHERGIAGAPVIPASHAGRTSNVCQLCHKGTTQ